MSQPRSQVQFDSAEQEVFLNLWRTYDCLKALEERVFSSFDLSAQQYNALRILQAAAPGKLPTLAIGRQLISRGPDVTRMLDRLETRQLIVRERRVENRRVVEVAITPEGQKLLEDMAVPVREMHQEQLGHLTATQRRDLIALLRKARRPHEEASSEEGRGGSIADAAEGVTVVP
jgi:DNA-binding MarR family transcriptional regulator